ncbi:hypothetical protein NFI96_002747 [Prochilodus magdalenae]|nr:hypothetical protein NFI96_002747 [Prochilodus magdalenae]
MPPLDPGALTVVMKSTPITPILLQLHWLPVKERIHYKILLLTFKALHGLAPTYLSALLHPYVPSRNLSTGTEAKMIVPPDWSNLTLQLQDSLTSAVGDFLEKWEWNITQAESVLDAQLTEENFRNVIWYLVVMIGMFAFIVVAILVSTVKSKRREHSNDPYHKYIEGDWSTQPQIQGYSQSYVISNPSIRTFDGPGSP